MVCSYKAYLFEIVLQKRGQTCTSPRLYTKYIFNVFSYVNGRDLQLKLLVSLMFQVLVLCPDDDPSLGSKLVAVYVKLFTSDLVSNVNIRRCCVCYINGGF